MRGRNKRRNRSVRSPYSARSFSLPCGAGGSTILIWRYLFPGTRAENKGGSPSLYVVVYHPPILAKRSSSPILPCTTPSLRPCYSALWRFSSMYRSCSLKVILCLSLFPFLSSGKTNFSGSKLETADATEHSLYSSTLKEKSYFLDCISICWFATIINIIEGD